MPNEDIVGMFTGRVCFSLIARTTTMKMRNIRRDNTFQECRQGPRDEIVGGAKVETFEHLEKLLC
jgi:hypothetical protein